MDPRDYEKELSRRHEAERDTLVSARTPPERVGIINPAASTGYAALPAPDLSKRISELEARVTRIEAELLAK